MHSPELRHWITHAEDETREVGSLLAGELRSDGVLLLDGDLGAGKTVLAQGVASGLGFDPGEVQSPTYTLIQEHARGETRLVHVDLYRLTPDEVERIGLEELLAGPGVKVVEWAERLPFPVAGALHVVLRRAADDECTREIVADLPDGGTPPES